MNEKENDRAEFKRFLAGIPGKIEKQSLTDRLYRVMQKIREFKALSMDQQEEVVLGIMKLINERKEEKESKLATIVAQNSRRRENGTRKEEV